MLLASRVAGRFLVVDEYIFPKVREWYEKHGDWERLLEAQHCSKHSAEGPASRQMYFQPNAGSTMSLRFHFSIGESACPIVSCVPSLLPTAPPLLSFLTPFLLVAGEMMEWWKNSLFSKCKTPEEKDEAQSMLVEWYANNNPYAAYGSAPHFESR